MKRPLTSLEVERLKGRPASIDGSGLPISFVIPPMPPSPGVRVFAPAVPGTLIDRPDRLIEAEERAAHRRAAGKSRDRSVAAEEARVKEAIKARLAEVRKMELEGSAGNAPEHLAVVPHPPESELTHLSAAVFEQKELKPGEAMATTLFGGNRRIFSDTSYPWSTIGQVVANGQGSGVLVGPRHLLTVSHAMVWNPDNSCGAVTFTPALFNSSAPFGSASVIHWYGYRKVIGPTLSSDDGAEDYVILVLNNRLGDICGWMGTRAYDSSWDDDDYDDHNFWAHVGYPGDIGGGVRPSFQKDIGLDSSDWDSDSHERLYNHADVWPGQSGGPFFAWWGSEGFPRVTGVQSGQDPDDNTGSGGWYINSLLHKALADFP